MTPHFHVRVHGRPCRPARLVCADSGRAHRLSSRRRTDDSGACGAPGCRQWAAQAGRWPRRRPCLLTMETSEDHGRGGISADCGRRAAVVALEEAMNVQFYECDPAEGSDALGLCAYSDVPSWRWPAQLFRVNHVRAGLMEEGTRGESRPQQEMSA